MRFGYTATRQYRPMEHDAIVAEHLGQSLIAEDEDATFVTGGCRGGDRAVGTIAVVMYPDARHEVVLPADRSQVDPWWAEPEYLTANIAIVECPAGTDFRYRNTRIVDLSDKVTALPYGRLERPRSGTWMTANIARRAGKLWQVVVLP